MGLNEGNLGYAEISKCTTLGWNYATLEVFVQSCTILAYVVHVAKLGWNLYDITQNSATWQENF